MNKFASLIVLGLLAGCAGRKEPVNLTNTATVNGLRLELYVLPAEPFYTAAEAAAAKAKEGMLIMGGAAPLTPGAESKPNHHLVVHIYDAKTNRAVPDAKVGIGFQPLDAKGKLAGAAVAVPIVVMQAIGQGAASTHYGNNVVMPAGNYIVTVTVNGGQAEFQVTSAGTANGSMEGMKM